MIGLILSIHLYFAGAHMVLLQELVGIHHGIGIITYGDIIDLIDLDLITDGVIKDTMVGITTITKDILIGEITYITEITDMAVDQIT
jgi:hypothetical protein|tara:strand:+ start:386 stop:646 length:261 start_codon:yes stop_codon:yes gene_type:complete